MSQGLAHDAGVLFLTSRVPGASTPPTVRWRGTYYQHEGLLHRPVTDEALEAQVTRWLATNPGARTDPVKNTVRPIDAPFLRDVMVAVRAYALVPDATEPGTWLKGAPPGAAGPFLATPAGVLDLGQQGAGHGVVLPGGPDFFAVSALPVAPDPAASRVRWLTFLGEALVHDASAIDVVQELFGYCLLGDCRFEAFFLLYGEANTGKSTVAETLHGLLGAANVSALPLDRLGEPFALADLVGKLANVVFDGGDIRCEAEGTFKALVSGEPVEVNQKHRPVRTMRLTAKHVFLANVLPSFADSSSGIWRRLILVPFERVCPPDARDPRLKHTLRAELPGIVHWALEGLARLLRQGGFTRCPRGELLAAEHRTECNPVALFLEEECVPDPGGRVGRRRLYDRFRAWADAGGHGKPLSRTKFHRAVAAIHPQPEAEVREGRGGDRMFVGIRLRVPADVVQRFRLLSEGQGEGPSVPAPKAPLFSLSFSYQGRGPPRGPDRPPPGKKKEKKWCIWCSRPAAAAAAGCAARGGPGLPA
jgi:P4 family phage/plasmid primase-like protien